MWGGKMHAEIFWNQPNKWVLLRIQASAGGRFYEAMQSVMVRLWAILVVPAPTFPWPVM